MGAIVEQQVALCPSDWNRVTPQRVACITPDDLEILSILLFSVFWPQHRFQEGKKLLISAGVQTRQIEAQVGCIACCGKHGCCRVANVEADFAKSSWTHLEGDIEEEPGVQLALPAMAGDRPLAVAAFEVASTFCEGPPVSPALAEHPSIEATEASLEEGVDGAVRDLRGGPASLIEAFICS